MRKLLRRFRREQRGAVLVIVAAAMMGMIGMAALAIDAGSWYQVQRRAQSAADAAALAGAQDLPTSTTAARADAIAYAATDLPGAPAPTVTFPTGTSIKVVIATTAPSFIKLFGFNSANVSATSVAAETGPATTCATAGNACDAVFAMNSSCTGTPVVFGGGTHITGGTASNGSLNVGGGGSSFGPTTYGNGSSCTVSPTGYAGESNTFTSGPTAQAAVTTWPVNYATDFPACTPGTGGTCTGPGGTPSFCTQASTATSWTLNTYNTPYVTSGNIYCDVGSGTAGTPTTWNGAISVAGGPVESSFVGGSVTIGGGTTLTACGYAASGYTVSGCSAAVPTPTTTNYPLIYAVGTATSAPTSTSATINNAGGGGAFTGDMFAPNGTIYMGGGDSTTFMEAQQVAVPGGGFTGDGPSDTGSGGGSSGSEALLQ
jgi:Flp pilus assembly protein TadG